MRKQSHREFRAAGGFNEKEWASFLEYLRNILQDENNRIGLEGRRLHGLSWDDWLDDLMDSGLGDFYWGPEAGRKWKFPEDKDKIHPYLKLVVQQSAGYVRESRRTELRRFKSSRADKSTSPNGSESLSESNQKKRPRDILSHSSTSNHIPVFGRSLEAISPPPAKRTRTSSNRENSRNRQDSSSSVAKAACFAITDAPNVGADHEKLDPDRGGGLTRLIEGAALPTISTASQVSAPTHESNVVRSGSAEKHPAPAIQQGFEFALETSVAGSIDIMLIHGPDVPTTAHFAKIFCQKHRLGPECKIQGIRVERLGLDNKLIHVDLTDERDWNHILRVLVSHRLRVEVLVAGPEAV